MTGWRSWLVASALFFPIGASAQVVRGRVLDRDSVVLSGVLVQLLNARGAPIARALTNERGEYRLIGAGAGSHRLRALRIGYRPVEGAPAELAMGTELVRDLVLASAPISLDTVRVLARNLCQIPSDSAASTFAVWEQARTALTAALLTARSQRIGATLVAFDRVLDPGMRRVRQQSAVVRSGLTSRPFVSIRADSLRRVGYVTSQDDWTTYYAPDLDVLLSAEFVEDHCFRLTSSSDATRIGIAFEPNPERNRIAEIKGTLWIDRRTAELRRMDFRYVNIPRPQAEHAGGEVEFARLRTGAWLISRWNIRMPVLRNASSEPAPGFLPPPLVRVVEVRVAGGELAAVTSGRDTIWRHPPLSVSGTVQDSGSRRPIAGARVSLRGTRLVVLSDARGQFTIPNALPGEYELETRTASLDSLGVVHRAPVVVMDTAVQVRLRMPSSSALLATFCGNELAGVRGQERGVVIGTVRVLGDSSARRDVAVGVEWHEFELRALTQSKAMPIQHTRELSGRSDRGGFFRICGVPVNTALRLRTALDERRTATTAARIPAQQRFTFVELLVDTSTSVRPPFE